MTAAARALGAAALGLVAVAAVAVALARGVRALDRALAFEPDESNGVDELDEPAVSA